ncbi:MAG: hypothetical protein ACOH13_15680 [Flavobacteriales bacterium]
MKRCKPLMLAFFLALPFAGIAQTEIEPNDSYTQSTPVAYNTPMAGSSGACSPTNTTVDYFSFTPPAQGTMRIRTAMSNTGGTDQNVTFNVRQSSTSVIATYVTTAGANNGVVNNTFLFTCQGTGLYYISIENPGGSECTNYSFRYDMVAPAFANDTEPNGSYTQADTAEAVTDHDGHLNFNYDDNDDYYRRLH